MRRLESFCSGLRASAAPTSRTPLRCLFNLAARECSHHSIYIPCHIHDVYKIRQHARTQLMSSGGCGGGLVVGRTHWRTTVQRPLRRRSVDDGGGMKSNFERSRTQTVRSTSRPGARARAQCRRVCASDYASTIRRRSCRRCQRWLCMFFAGC